MSLYSNIKSLYRETYLETYVRILKFWKCDSNPICTVREKMLSSELENLDT